MKLYLARHGDAVEPYVDSARPLSPKGCQQITAMGQWLATNEVTLNYIFHSSKLRAQQTAELLGLAVSPSHPAQTMEGLLPNDELESILNMVEHLNDNTLLVGHLPYMALLASTLITGNADPDLFQFHPGSMMSLTKLSSQRWSLEWLVAPDRLLSFTSNKI